jgi:hypothetical protein
MVMGSPNRRARAVFVLTFVAGLSFAACAHGAAGVRLIGITGNQGRPNDETLYDISLNNFALTELVKLPFIPDTDAIGFNPVSGLLHRVSGADAYSDDPANNGYRDNQFMQTVDVLSGSFAQKAIFNANSEQFGPAAPRPTWVLPAARRTDAQTDPSFRQHGANEYHSLRGMAWSNTEKVFYGADEGGLFRLTPDGVSTFVGRPPNDPADPNGALEPDLKGIAFFTINGKRVLLASEKSSANLWTLDTTNGQKIGPAVTIKDPHNPALPIAGVLGLAENPDGSSLLGISKGADAFSRELISINPVTGDTTALAPLGVHMADITFVGVVPEPSAVVLGIIGVMVLASRRARRAK